MTKSLPDEKSPYEIGQNVKIGFLANPHVRVGHFSFRHDGGRQLLVRAPEGRVPFYVNEDDVELIQGVIE